MSNPLDPFRITALHHAQKYVGVKEHPPGSNSGPFIDKWLRDAGVPPHNPWCMAFVHGMFLEAGLNIGGGASVGNFEEWARQRGEIVHEPVAGDVLCFNFTADNWPDHVGFVRKRLSSTAVATVEGNTGIGNDANGGEVMNRVRSRSRCVFVRIPGRPSMTHPPKKPSKPSETGPHRHPAGYHLVRRHGIIMAEPIGTPLNGGKVVT